VIALDRCPVCRGDRSSPAELGMLRCADCATVRAREYADHGEVFTDGYFEGGAGDYGVDLTHPRFREYLRVMGHERLAVLERATGGPGSLVDVGCGTGELLAAAAERGWRAVGVEPLAAAAEAARARWSVEVRTALLQDSGLPERSFDAVCANHVLEHMPDARDFLALLARWARPGGIVAVESPNWDSEQRRRSGERWMHLRPSEHLVHYSPATIAEAARQAGLEVLEVRTPSHLERGQTLDEALANLGRPQWRRPLAALSPWRDVAGSRARVPSDPAWWLLRAAQWWWNRRGVGQAVLLVARMPGGSGE
jgi:SAM-dependent methyltransferase